MIKNKNRKVGPGGKPIVIATQDPVAKVLWQKTFREQVKPSKKEYDRKKQKQNTRQLIGQS